MDWKLFATIFASIFIAELGDKTQLATLLFSADGKHSRWMVFLAASAALVTTTALGVVAGQWISKMVPPRYLQWTAGAGFIAIGLWMLWAAGQE